MIPKLAIIAFVIICFFSMGYVAYTSALAFIENERNEAYQEGRLEAWKNCVKHFEDQIDSLRQKTRYLEFTVEETNQFMREMFWEVMTKQLQDTTYAEVNDGN